MGAEMKRILLLMTILSVSVFSTACISNFAIKELNNKAQAYLSNGDVDSAICRLKSSLDLDSELYETHYNLAVAYLAADNQQDAIESLKRVVELKPDYNDAYYSLGVANSTLAYKLMDMENSENEDGSRYELSPEEKQNLNIYLNEAVDNYNRYISNAPKAENADEIKNQIEQLSQLLKERSEQMREQPQEDEEYNYDEGNDDEYYDEGEEENFEDYSEEE